MVVLLASRGLEQRVTVEAPAELGEVLTSLAPNPRGDGWQAADYDELVDNPIFVADASVQRFRIDGHDYVLVQVGDTSLWDLEKSLADVRRIVRATKALSQLLFQVANVLQYLVHQAGRQCFAALEILLADLR